MLRATVQNGDVYFQVREANNTAYDQLADVVEDVMAQVAGVTGREYHVFDYYGAADATDVVVAMGSVSGTAQEACDYLNARAQADGTGKRYGFLQVHLYRPFSSKALPGRPARNRAAHRGARPLQMHAARQASRCTWTFPTSSPTAAARAR